MPALSRLLGKLRRHRGARVAVLPFTTDDGALGTGMSDALIGLLSRAQRIDTVGPISSRDLGLRSQEPPSVADEVGADHLLHGHVRLVGDELSVKARLVRAPGGGEVWAQGWTERSADLFSIQNDIARNAAAALGIDLPAVGDRLMHREPTSDPAAHRLYLEGKDLLASGGPLRDALDRFESALELDGLFALAWAAVAETYRLAIESHVSIGVKNPLATVRRAADRALELDDSLPEGHLSVGYAEFRAWRLDAAEAHLRLAIALAPSYAQAHRWLALCQLHAGDFHGAIIAADRAAELEPLSDTIVNESGWPRALSGRALDAIERSQRVVHHDPEHAMAYCHLGRYAEQLGKRGEAVTYYRAAAALAGRNPLLTGFLGMSLVAIGDCDEAESLANDLVRKARRGSPVAACLGALLVRLGQTEEGLRWLAAAAQAKEPIMLLLDSHWLPLPEVRDQPAFRALRDLLPKDSAVGKRP